MLILLPHCACVCVCVCVCVCSCPTPHDPMNCSPPSSCVRGIFQARILEWVAISFSSRSPKPGDQTHISFISCTGRWLLYQLCNLGRDYTFRRHLGLIFSREWHYLNFKFILLSKYCQIINIYILLMAHQMQDSQLNLV